MKLEKRDVINICKIVAFGIILYCLLQNISSLAGFFGTLFGILSPFIAGAAIAFIINIPMSIFEKKVFKSKKNAKSKVSKIKRFISIILSLVIIILIIVGIIFLVIPELINVITSAIEYLPELFNNIKEILKQIVTDYPEVEGTIMNIQSNLESFNTETIKELTALGTTLVTSSFGVISSTISAIFDTIIAIIFATYILMGKEKILLQCKRITYAFLNKENADRLTRIATLSRESFSNFITGQFTECIILGSLCALGMLILRIPYSATIGVLIAVTAFIPIVGAIIGAVIGIILLLPISFTKAVTFLVFFVILQQIENNVIYPRVVGESVGIPGILVLVAVTIGGALGGALGMVIGLPITAVLYTLLKESITRRLKEKGFEKEIVIASNNKGKIREVQELLNDYKIISLNSSGIDIDVVEDGNTFEENAIKKATEISKALNGMPCLADDSGIEIEILNGFPGVKTKRWMEDTDRNRNLAIIEKMKGIPKEKRSVIFKSVIALAENGNVCVGTGIIKGYITESPRGENGFGFDEIFELENGKTLAELTDTEKNKISARKLAIDDLKNKLK